MIRIRDLSAGDYRRERERESQSARDLYEMLLAICNSIAARPDIQKLMGPQEIAGYNAAVALLAKARGEGESQ